MLRSILRANPEIRQSVGWIKVLTAQGFVEQPLREGSQLTGLESAHVGHLPVGRNGNDLWVALEEVEPQQSIMNGRSLRVANPQPAKIGIERVGHGLKGAYCVSWIVSRPFRVAMACQIFRSIVSDSVRTEPSAIATLTIPPAW
jgi:hypothetical protein